MLITLKLCLYRYVKFVLLYVELYSIIVVFWGGKCRKFRWNPELMFINERSESDIENRYHDNYYRRGKMKEGFTFSRSISWHAFG